MSTPSVRRTRRAVRAVRATTVATAALALLAVTACTSEDPEPSPGTSLSPSPSAGSESPTPTASSDSPTPSASATLAGFSLEEKKTSTWPSSAPRSASASSPGSAPTPATTGVVYQFSLDGKPTYRVRWVEAPIEDGSGKRRDVPGDAWLEVLVTSVDIPGESAPSPDGPLPATLEGTGIAAADPIWGGFEGYGQQFIGVTGEQRPFRVSVLSAPTRLVVDIAR